MANPCPSFFFFMQILTHAFLFPPRMSRMQSRSVSAGLMLHSSLPPLPLKKHPHAYVSHIFPAEKKKQRGWRKWINGFVPSFPSIRAFAPLIRERMSLNFLPLQLSSDAAPFFQVGEQNKEGKGRYVSAIWEGKGNESSPGMSHTRSSREIGRLCRGGKEKLSSSSPSVFPSTTFQTQK